MSSHAGCHLLPGHAFCKAEDKYLPGEIIVYGCDVVLQDIPLPDAPASLFSMIARISSDPGSSSRSRRVSMSISL